MDFNFNDLITMGIGAAVPIIVWLVAKGVSGVRTMVANSANKIDDQVLAAMEQALKKALDQTPPTNPPA